MKDVMTNISIKRNGKQGRDYVDLRIDGYQRLVRSALKGCLKRMTARFLVTADVSLSNNRSIGC